MTIQGRQRFIRLAWDHLREFRWRVAGSMVLILGASVFELAGVVLVIPLLEQMGSAAGDSTVSNRARQFVEALGLQDSFTGLLMLFTALALVKFVLTEWAAFSGRVLSASLRFRMRQRMFANLMDLPLGFFYKTKPGDLISSLDTSTTESSALVENLVRIVNVAVFSAVDLLVQLLVSAWMTVAVLAFTVLSYFLVSPRFSISFVQGQEAKRLIDATVSFLQDRLAGIKTIKAFGNDIVHRREFDRLGSELRALAIGMQRNKIVAHAFGEPFTTVGVVGMLVLGVQVLGLGVVELMTFFYAYSLLVPRVKALTSEVLMIVEKLGHFEKVQELITRDDKVYLPKGTLECQGLGVGLELRGVSFAYGADGPPVLAGINLTIGRMQTVALVGSSGAGKTTLVDLILRLHDPTGGAVLVDGHDLRDYDLETWHRRLAVVEQDPFLFNDTVVNNIRYGRPDATDAEVREAARLAYAEPFIMKLPGGFDTVVGQRGMALSGGQRQRVALARALLRRPDLLILDEATSALDSESESLVQEAIQQVRRQCTVIVIAHRLSTILGADWIAIIDGGRVVEEGTHRQLLDQQGLYHRYYTLQTAAGAQ